MTGLLSTISGFFSKPLILGIFLPTVIFVGFFTLFAAPLLPEDYWLVKQLESLDTQWKVVSISFTTIVLSGLLYNLNIPIIRFYEGYPWRRTWIGKRRTSHHREQFIRLNNKQRGMRTLVRAMISADATLADSTKQQVQAVLNSHKELRGARKALLRGGTSFGSESWEYWKKEISATWKDITRKLLHEYPGKEQLVLPTEMGNVIRSFEYYPDREYGIDAITLWPRLIAKIDKEYAASIDDAKTTFDFMLNCSALSAILVLILLLLGLLIGAPFSSLSNVFPWLLKLIAFSVVSYAAYLGAINRAPAWGVKVKSAFDLYRNDLLAQLGFKQKLENKQAERDLWDGISQQLEYGDHPSGPNVDYVPPTHLVTEPPRIRVELSRGLKQVGESNSYEVLVAVRNVDSAEEVASKITLTETLSTGWDYQWGSAEVYDSTSDNVETITAIGSNPYFFQLGELNFNEEKILTYRAYFHGHSK